MDVSELLSALNTQQRQAVSAPLGNHLILAGAGTGKTRVLTQRIAWLIQVENISPYHILAVTFTNKASKEMRTRIETSLSESQQGLWLGTFHSICHRMLYHDPELHGLPSNFQIIDNDDQYRLIKKIQKEYALDDTRFPPRKTQAFINNHKEQGQRSCTLDANKNPQTATLLKVYIRYEEICLQGGLVDFTELLLRSYETLSDQETLRAHYQEKFRQILVDEFQDTNTLQYRWLHLILGTSNHIMAVGDDDQSIYSWRGANHENIALFQQDFSQTTVTRLEQNYRSTRTILHAANALIAYNSKRLGKKLWTEGQEGKPIALHPSYNEFDEARFIVSEIQHLTETHFRHHDIAIFYRSNAQSRVIEECLTQANVPYVVYGGLRFFERAEIKDCLAYLRLTDNPHDDSAFERIVNNPPRGIGNASLEHLRQLAQTNHCSLWSATQTTLETASLPKRALDALQRFSQCISNFQEQTINLPVGEQGDYIIRHSGLIEALQKDNQERALYKLENIEELINAIEQYDKQPQDTPTTLTLFLSSVALDSGEQGHATHDSVQLMTLHAAKGLEFPVVFITGLEEGLFPHQMSASDSNGLEEERRLCYVGMTRAKEQLTLTYAECRRIYRKETYQRPSRFIAEIPQEYLAGIRLHTKTHTAQTSAPTSSNTTPAYRLGQHVTHPTFGEGVILNSEGQGEQMRLQVRFQQHGVKWLLQQYANLATLP